MDCSIYEKDYYDSVYSFCYETFMREELSSEDCNNRAAYNLGYSHGTHKTPYDDSCCQSELMLVHYKLGYETAARKKGISEGESFGHPYVPSPTEVLYPDNVYILD